MNTLFELGSAVAERRRLLELKQGVVAKQAGISQELLSRFERGAVTEQTQNSDISSKSTHFSR